MNNKYIPYDYKKAEEKAKRAKAFYEGGTGKAQIMIRSCAFWQFQKVPPLNSFRFPEDLESYLDYRAERDYAFARLHEELDDDYIATTMPWYGVAEHTAFLGGKVDFSAETSFHHQVCEEIGDFRNLMLDRENLWIHLVIDGMAYLREKWGEYVPVRMRGVAGPSDFANAIRGNDLFYDIYDEPEELKELLKLCVEAGRFTNELQLAEATKIGDGCVNGNGIWMPGRCIGHISEDFSTMISPEVYEEFFFPALAELVNSYDMTKLHVHSMGQRMIPFFTQLKKIRIMEIVNDPNNDRSLEVFRKYHKVLEDVAVIVDVTYEELTHMEDILESSKTIIWYQAKDEDDAKRAIAAIEKYR